MPKLSAYIKDIYAIILQLTYKGKQMKKQMNLNEYKDAPDELLAYYEIAELDSHLGYNDELHENLCNTLFQFGKYSKKQMKRHKELLKNRVLIKKYIKEVVMIKNHKVRKTLVKEYSWIITVQSNILFLLKTEASTGLVKRPSKEYQISDFSKWVLKNYSNNKPDYLDDIEDTLFGGIINFMFEEMTKEFDKNSFDCSEENNKNEANYYDTFDEEYFDIPTVNPGFGIDSCSEVISVSMINTGYPKELKRIMNRLYTEYIGSL